jgi:outer membrane protein TolC
MSPPQPVYVVAGPGERGALAPRSEVSVVKQTGGLTPPARPELIEETIDLGIALRLAGVDNPTINLAREQVREALAGQLAARALLLPSVNVGGNVRLHAGAIQNDPGDIQRVSLQSAYLGLGAGAVGANPTTLPGVRLFAHLGDAVYEPLAARQRVAARAADADAVRNDVLLQVAAAYLELVGAEARLGVLRRGEADAAEVARLTRVFAEKGQGRQADADRAAATAALVRRDAGRAAEEVGVASAGLCRLLNLDPAVRLRTPGGAVEPLRLVPEAGDPEPLVAAAVRTRPEVLARAAELHEARVRVRQEQVRPLVPTVSVGYSTGVFGGGGDQTDPRFGPLRGRSDFDAYAVWTVQNLGLGNRAEVHRTGAVVGQAAANYDRAVNQVRREVIEAQAAARAAARQIELATAAVATAEEGFRLEAERVRQGRGLPIELLDSFQQLLDARQEVVRAVVAFDVAQFRLFVALGCNPLAAPPAGR